jgi:hypothetical protein
VVGCRTTFEPSDHTFQFLTEAERIARSLKKKDQSDKLAEVAEVLATIDPDNAECIARSLSEGYSKTVALSDIAEELAAAS